MCCKDKPGLCPSIVSVINLVLLGVALGFPYLFTRTVNPGGNVQISPGVTEPVGPCTVTTLFGWQDLYCNDDGGSGCDSTTCNPAHQNWRTTECGSGSTSCPTNTEMVMNITAGLLALATVFAVFVLLGSCLHWCRQGTKTNKLWFWLGLLGLLCLAASCVYYAVAIPGAVMSDSSGCSQGPCESFAGSYTSDALPGINVVVSWGPAGWCFAAISFPFYVYLVWATLKAAGGWKGDGGVEDSSASPGT